VINSKGAHEALEKRLSSVEDRAKKFLPAIEKDILNAIENDCNMCVSMLEGSIGGEYATEKVAEAIEKTLKNLGYEVDLTQEGDDTEGSHYTWVFSISY